MNDPAIRAILRGSLAGHRQRIVEEWDIGGSRVDVATIRPTLLSAYEIKSPVDSLVRLEGQAHDYGRIFDVCTLVTVDEHVRAAERVLPDWWGISVVDGGRIVVARHASVNPNVDTMSLAWLLWTRELRAILAFNGFIPPVGGRIYKPKLVEIAARNIGPKVFRLLVCEALLQREGWRP